MKNRNSSALMSLIFVVKLFIKAAPFKVIAECILSGMKNVLVVINSVWLLDKLAGLVLDNAPFSDTLRVLIVVVLINILASVAQNFYDYCVKRQSDLKVKSVLDNYLMKHADKLALYHYEDSEFYTTVKQAQNAASVTVYAAYADFIQTMGNVVALMSAVVVAVTISPILLFFVGFTIPMIWISKKYGQLLSEKNMALVFSERKKQYARNTWLSKDIVRMFKITNCWKIADKHYEEGYKASINLHEMYSRRLFGWNILGTEFSITLIMISCYVYGIFASEYSDKFSIASFSVMFVAVMNMISRIRKIYKSYENFCGYGVRLKALQEFEKLEPEDISHDGILPGEFETLEFRNVWFSYDGTNWVLKNVSFQIKAGEKVSIIGFNGAGKSTLIKLILRFYPVTQGEILYNGVNINLYQLSEYRKKFATAFQDYKLFSISIAENVLMEECPTQMEKRVKDVLFTLGGNAVAADIEKIVGREYDTEGVVLSGGQQQLLAIARLYFSTFNIAILDEPSAALDPITAKHIQDELMCLAEKKTMFVVSHDMSVTKDVDKILFFDSGQLVAYGEHNELLLNSPKYASFYESQAQNYREKI